MKNRKWIFLVVAVVIIASLLLSVGCTSTTTSPTTTPTTTTPTTTTPTTTTTTTQATATVPAGFQLNVGSVTSCSRYDYAWGTSNYRATEYLKEQYGAVTTFVDLCPGSSQEKVMRDFIAGGANVIVAWGWEFIDAANKVAADYPYIPFVITCAPDMGTGSNARNLSSMYFAEEQPAYLAGLLAGMMSKTGKLGFISGMEIPCVSKTVNMFRQGAYDINPDIKVFTAYLGSWADVAKERELTSALIDQGADIIFALWVGLAAADVCEERDVWMIGSQFLQEYKPSIVLADHSENMTPAISNIMDLILSAKIEAKSYQMTMDVGVSDLKLNPALVGNPITQDMVDKIDQARQDIISGKIQIPRLTRPMPETWPAEKPADYDTYLEKVGPLNHPGECLDIFNQKYYTP